MLQACHDDRRLPLSCVLTLTMLSFLPMAYFPLHASIRWCPSSLSRRVLHVTIRILIRYLSFIWEMPSNTNTQYFRGKANKDFLSCIHKWSWATRLIARVILYPCDRTNISGETTYQNLRPEERQRSFWRFHLPYLQLEFVLMITVDHVRWWSNRCSSWIFDGWKEAFLLESTSEIRRIARLLVPNEGRQGSALTRRNEHGFPIDSEVTAVASNVPWAAMKSRALHVSQDSAVMLHSLCISSGYSDNRSDRTWVHERIEAEGHS